MAQRFTPPMWMGYPQGGHSWTTFSEYPSPTGLHRESVAFYLSWHTFGLLEAVFGRNVEESQLLDAPVHGQVQMKLDRVQPMLIRWAVAMSNLRNDDGEGSVRDHLIYTAATQRAAYNQFMGLVARRYFGYPGSEHLEICRLVNYAACLGEAFWIITKGLFNRFLGPNTIPRHLQWASAPPLHDDSMFHAVVADGWCPSTINYMLSRATLATVRLALLRGPLYEEQHPDCTGTKCALAHVDTEHYVTRHTLEGCVCSFVGPDMSRIAELLRQEIFRSSPPRQARAAAIRYPSRSLMDPVRNMLPSLTCGPMGSAAQRRLGSPSAN
ncbi:hypothetical protein N657DRAFT_669923 [Parathielavia appendiculata]|uniref:Uncharacterized protein n=1 Tax=Parathielavia appendiculata TaxID=2587402 RepID=A0AAN6U3L6_9PEZI|nr:hypothetical protein N657DRAFT_669923 [Parathielavia appendiculata]